MKKSLIPSVLGLLLLTACNSTQGNLMEMEDDTTMPADEAMMEDDLVPADESMPPVDEGTSANVEVEVEAEAL